ncbi:MAG: cyanophycinase [Ignavibacteriaceae bacterium]|nr:cyanophycinase [Ignavibacteriaceae bacterium]
MKKLFLLLAVLLYAESLFSQGYLVIIGGGERPDTIMNRFLELAGGENANILIIPNASAYKEEEGGLGIQILRAKGAKNVSLIRFERETASDDSVLAKLDGIDGIFFTGGDQSKLTGELLGTKLYDKIMEFYKKGGVIGGTSAGAAFMSKVMITGDELINKDSSYAFHTIMPGNIKTAEGFGFLDNCIIDQHFVVRRRLNRLISAVLDNPQLPGIGIDESTALIVAPDMTFEVLGSRNVVIVNAAGATDIKVNHENLYGAQNIKIDILVSGDRYDLKTGKVIK